MDLSDGGPFTASRDSCPGADAKFLAGFMAKNFVAGASHPGQMEREGLRLPPGKSTAKQAAEVAAAGDCCAIRRSFLTPSGVQERRSRRDRGGATGTVAASPVFTHRTVATARNRASGFGGDWRVRQQLPVVVGPDDRMPPGSREPKWAQQKQPETVTVSRNITPVHGIQPYTTF
ncbi:hypothetical protein ECZU36_58800 [Escherichia coli]|nr:hypothetical protein ECZU36_58800 [Escherichia coli]